MFKRIMTTILAAAMLAFLPQVPVIAEASELTTDINLVVDGEDITELSAPVIVDNRTLIPVRFVAEALGAEVGWDGETYTVTVDKGKDHLRLIIDSRLVQYDLGESYQIIDVAPRIINDRTYVPLRVVSNALGIGISWDGDTRTVYVDSSETSDVEPFYELNMVSLEEGDTITGKTDIEIDVPDKYKDIDGNLRLLLLDGETGTGFIKDSRDVADSILTFIPGTETQENKVLAAVLYDKNGNFLAGDALSVDIDVDPKVELPEIKDYSRHQDELVLNPDINFLSKYVIYEFQNLKTGKVTKTSERDPYGSYTFTPSFEEAGEYTVKATAYDTEENSYVGEALHVTIDVDRSLSLSGVYDGKTIDSPVALIASRNYDVTETQYIIRDPDTGRETLLRSQPYGEFDWFPSSEDGFDGEMDLIVRVKDTGAVAYEDLEISDEELIHDFDDLDGLLLTQYPSDSQGDMDTSSRSKDGRSVKLSYDFTTMIPDDQSITFIEFGKDGRKIDGKPASFSMWVYGDDSDHWLRCRIIDAAGELYKIDFADEVDWKGWKKVTAEIPYGVTYPISLKNIYIAEIEYDERDDGAIYIDQLTANYAKESPSNFHDSEPVRVTVDGSPRLLLKGVGPGQVLTGDVNLSVASNLDIDSVEYYMKNLNSGKTTLLGEASAGTKVTFSPTEYDSGDISIYAVGYYDDKEIESEAVDLEVFLGETYTSEPISGKMEFKEMASEMAVESYKKTGMSAALQTAQAILETGWGQYIPVDKYDGTFSNNLFGIKGTGSNGSVIVNTWEVYNGVSFRCDDYFRAYETPEESWVDHKALLLEKERYEGFRDVMYDYTLGAFAIRRAGYATDPDYPIKLIYIINHYDLIDLDRISI
ncbi:Flagellum-specific peptidoglycan hydrolase FlgJ [Dethiosulfatibacter aminovorans DSM 17477]|uniref:Flagellum-specific peptidoglycan hydrolase FlgJ n=1 Tax=Dethiosulfatibacter aminovorans DSM 17477 TaxID=1121476 RepID=A0A1M6BW36_9FIRM|nr:stalk domain-containing protein [Dethiosulfatibacter aminovorans]SHI52833.1 Flagellum-specific peptidoglycan hydrolase FlgJ [Dethiosulfatibacter aminovorans DSM 17477]